MDVVYVYDADLHLLAIVDAYKSLIWAPRYNDVGDCELYLPADDQSLSLYRKGNYIARPDDDMICRIEKIELTTNSEDGNYLIVTAKDAKSLLDRRVVWTTTTANGRAEPFILQMVSEALGSTALPERQIVNSDGNLIFDVAEPAGFTEKLTEQVSYKNVGEKVRDYCQRYKWGYKITLDAGKLVFALYAGADRSGSVIFSPEYDNLAESTYVEDETNLGNTALVAGEGEGAARSRQIAGNAEGVDRCEIYVDAKDLSKTITWQELTHVYPTQSEGGNGYIAGDAVSGWTYRMTTVDVQIIDAAQLGELQIDYPGGVVVTIDGTQYFRITDADIADLPSGTPANEDEVKLRDVIYDVYLLTRGYEKLAEYGAVTSFEGTIEPSTTFEYKRDYFLGDLVTVKNEFGVSVAARIVEVVEVNDDNGYSVEPKFEYLTEE